MKQEIPYARYDYAVQPREVDLTKRATIITLGDSILHTAGEDADRIGFGIRNLQSKDSTWVLSRMAVEIDRLPAEYERYTVGTWVGEIGRLMTTRNFIVTDAGGQRIAAASTLWAMIDVKTRQPLDLRDNVDYSRALLAIPCPIDKPAKIGRIEGVPCDSRRVRYSDIDFNQHTNSMKYIQWMLDALPLRTATGRMLRTRGRQGPFRNQVRRRDRRLQSRHTMGNLRRTLKPDSIMKKSILAVAVAAILISCGPKPAAISLFNGKDLNGWTAVLEDSTLHPSTEFTVEDGAISLSGKFGYIRTEIPGIKAW